MLLLPNAKGIIDSSLKLIIFAVAFSTVKLSAQNLVANSGFEFHFPIGEENDHGPLEEYAFFWQNPSILNDIHSASPDFFYGQYEGVAPCWMIGEIGYIYSNYAPAEGMSCAGIFGCTRDSAHLGREYFGQELLSPLIQGETYQISAKIKLHPSYHFATGIGFYFFANQQVQIDATPLATEPIGGYSWPTIQDTNWTTYTFEYTALGDENYFYIGNYDDSTNEHLLDLSSNFSECANFHYRSSYYLIDDISIVPNYSFFYVSGDSLTCRGDETALYAGGEIDHWECTAEPGISISDSSLVFVNPLETTTYRAFGLIDTLDITVHVSQPASITLPNDTSICVGEELLITPEYDEGFLYSNFSNSFGNISEVLITYSEDDTLNIYDIYPEYYALNYGTSIRIISSVQLEECVTTDTMLVEIIPVLTPFANPFVGWLCEGDSVYTTVSWVESNGYSYSDYSFSDHLGNPLYEEVDHFYVSDTGNYDIHVEYLDQCSWILPMHIQFYPEATPLPNPIVICPGDTVYYPVEEGMRTYFDGHTYFDSVPIFEVGSFYAAAKNYCNVGIGQTIQVMYPPSDGTILPDDFDLCLNDSATIVIDSLPIGVYLLWQDGDTTDQYTVHSAGMYTVDWIGNYCQSSDTLLVNELPIPLIELGPDSVLCEGQTITLDAGYPFTVCEWQNGLTAPFLVVDEEGTYSVIVTMGECSVYDTIRIEYIPAPIWISPLSSDTTLCVGSALVLTYDGEFDLVWTDGSQESEYVVNDPELVTIEASHYCETIEEQMNVAFRECDCGIKLGRDLTFLGNIDINRITPQVKCAVENYHYVIYSAEGKLVYESSTPNESSYSLHELSNGVYRYLIQGTFEEFEEAWSGTIVVVR